MKEWDVVAGLGFIALWLILVFIVFPKLGIRT